MEASSSAINAPHPDDVPEEAADAFFGDEDEGGDEAEAAASAEAAAEADAVGEEAEPAATPAEPDPTPAEEPSGTSTEPEPAASAGQTEAESRNAEREYIVFQKVPLTEKVLKHLLAQIDKGDAPKPRVAFFELHRAVTRNDRQAVAEAYKANKGVLGDECDLAAVSSRSFKERHVAPRVVTPTDGIAIT